MKCVFGVRKCVQKFFSFLRMIRSIPIARQIRETHWYAGELYLEKHPDVTQILIHKSNQWEYKLIRTEKGFQRQIFLNGIRME